jgi:acyl-CoA reductase-like NAD-dependent aldehyde dehydrogenase
MTDTLKTISPVDGRVYVERPLETAAGIDRALDARSARSAPGAVPLAARCEVLAARSTPSSPRRATLPPKSPGRWDAPFATRPARCAASRSARATCLRSRPRRSRGQPADKAGFERQIKRVPLGVVVVVAPWNYPYLTAVNAVLPALIAGNAVVLKHSHQTPLCAERFLEAFASAGVPAGRIPIPASVARRYRAPDGRSARRERLFHGFGVGRKSRRRATAAGFATSGLELGGKDPAYVRADANLAHAVESLTDGAFFNAGQSCCGIKRIYVAASRYEEFVAGVVD